MKHRMTGLLRACLLTFLLLGFDMIANGQVSPTAVLVDEFARVGCEDLSGRLDVFLSELKKDPNATGYIAVSSAPDLGWLEKFIDGYARYRAFDESRLILIRTNLREAIQTQMWSVPAGAELPVEPLIESRGVLETLPRKYRLYSDFGEIGACYTGPPFGLMSKALKMNPEYSANIAIGSPSVESFKKAKDDIKRSFQQDYLIDPSRLRFFWIRTEYDPKIYELWLIRRK